jgi:hypothetical protein
MSLEIIGLRECRPPTSRSESDLNTEFGPTRLGSVQRGSSGGAVPSPAVSQYSDELRRPAWRLQGSHSAKNPAPQNLGQAHVCARDLLEMIDDLSIPLASLFRGGRASIAWVHRGNSPGDKVLVLICKPAIKPDLSQKCAPPSVIHKYVRSVTT